MLLSFQFDAVVSQHIYKTLFSEHRGINRFPPDFPLLERSVLFFVSILYICFKLIIITMKLTQLISDKRTIDMQCLNLINVAS